MLRLNGKAGGWVAAALCVAWLGQPAWAQFGELDKIKGAIEKGAGKTKSKPDAQQAGEQPEAATATGKIIFSGAPIDPAKPEKLVKSFKAGDHIYGLVQSDKTWRDLLGKSNPKAKEVQIPFDMLIDGERADFQYITIKKPEALDTKTLVFDVAPELDKMTAYRDPTVQYGEGKGRRKIGPDQYTYILAALAPGKHTVTFQIRSYGDVLAAGEFTIEGEDYKAYETLREQVLAELQQGATMPPAQKIDKELEATMRKLLDNAGWTNIRKLIIVDKDWWLDRASGGDSPIVSRHIAAAVAAKAEDGSFFWCKCTFHQQKLIDGSFGPLELTHQGDKRPILEKNIDK